MATVIPRQPDFFQSFLQSMQAGQQMFFQNEQLKQQKEALNLKKKAFEQTQLEAQAEEKRRLDAMGQLVQFFGGGQSQPQQPQQGLENPFGPTPTGAAAAPPQPQPQAIDPLQAVMAAEELGPGVGRFVAGHIEEAQGVEALAGAGQVLDAIEAGNTEGITFSDAVEALSIADVPDKRSNEILRATFPTPSEGAEDLVADATTQATIELLKGGLNTGEILQAVQSGRITPLGMAALNKLGILGSLDNFANTQADNQKIIRQQALKLKDELNLETIPLPVFEEIVRTGGLSEASQKRLPNSQLAQLGTVLESRKLEALSSHAAASAGLTSQVYQSNPTIMFNVERAKRAFDRGNVELGNQLLGEASATFDEATAGTGLPNTVPLLVQTSEDIKFKADPKRIGFITQGGEIAFLARQMDERGIAEVSEMKEQLVLVLKDREATNQEKEAARRLIKTIDLLEEKKVDKLKLKFGIPKSLLKINK